MSEPVAKRTPPRKKRAPQLPSGCGICRSHPWILAGYVDGEPQMRRCTCARGEALLAKDIERAAR